MYCFVESHLFSRIVRDYLTDAEYAKLQAVLTADPSVGNVIPGSGGVRKLRWAGSGRGKQGGVRIIYFLRMGLGQIWMLTVYAKNEEQTIPAHILRRIREEIDD